MDAESKTEHLRNNKGAWVFIILGLALLAASTGVVFYYVHLSSRSIGLPIKSPQALVYNEGDCKLIAFDPDGEWEKTTDVYDGNENGKKCYFDFYMKETIFYNDDFSSIKSTSRKYPEIKLPVNYDTKLQNISTYVYLIAVEHQSKKIYAVSVDDRYELDKLIVVDFERREDGSNDAYFNIMATEINSPKDIVLNSYFIYIVEKTGITAYWKKGKKLGTVIKKSGITSMAVDSDGTRLYWIRDGPLSVLESSLKYGAEYRQIVASTNRLTNVVYVNNKTFWLENSQQHVNSIRCLDDGQRYPYKCKNTYLNLWRGGNEIIKAYDFNKMKLTSNMDACRYKNGGCEHLCFSVPPPISCACKLGYRLKPDGKSCKLVTQNFMLYVRGVYVGKRVIVDNIEDSFTEIAYPVRVARNNIISFDTLQVNHFYATDGQYLYRRHLQSNDGVEILVSDARAVAVDWAANQVYVATQNKIRVLPYDFVDLAQSKVVREIDDPNSEFTNLVVQSNRGYVFFTQKNTITGKSYIYKMNSDGSDVNLLYKKPVSDSTNMAVDAKDDRLYWFTGETQEIPKAIASIKTFGASANFSILNLQHVSPSARSISVHDKYVYVSNSSDIYRMNKSDETKVTRQYSTGSTSSQPIIGHYIYTSESQKIENSKYPCKYGEHTCERLCFAIQLSNGSFTSKCQYFDGEAVDDDGSKNS